MKKFILISLLMIAPLMIGSCAKKANTDINQLNGKYHYENKDLGFQVDLPAEFQYFQTQRKKGDGFVDLEFFVPTSDITYAQEVKGYAKPFLIRVFEKEAWNKFSSGDESKTFAKIGESDRVYAIQFWRNEPKDWIGIWNENYKKSLINLIKIY